jgi:Leucine-rich repeat (LRR) protein
MLERLDLSGNSIKSLNWLEGAAARKYLIVADNGLSALPLMPVLPSLMTLDLSGNELTDVSGLTQPELVYLNLTGNPVADTPLVPGSPKLDRIDFDSAPAFAAANGVLPAENAPLAANSVYKPVIIIIAALIFVAVFFLIRKRRTYEE